MTTRPILEEIRRVRHAISEEIGHDPHRITDYYAGIQADLKDRIVNRGGESKTNRPIQCNEAVKPDNKEDETVGSHVSPPMNR